MRSKLQWGGVKEYEARPFCLILLLFASILLDYAPLITLFNANTLKILFI